MHQLLIFDYYDYCMHIMLNAPSDNNPTRRSSSETSNPDDLSLDANCSFSNEAITKARTPDLTLLQSIAERRKESLLCHTDEILRNQVIVCPSLEVGAHPNIDLHKVVKSHLGRDEYAVFHELVSPFKIGVPLRLGEDEIIAVDKMRPHGICDLMMTQSDPFIKSQYEDLSIGTRVVLANHILQFGEYCKDNDLYPVVSYSVDPVTFDRKSAQSSKRFHIHFVGRMENEVETILNSSSTLHSLSHFEKRRLVDETAIILGYALGERLMANNLMLNSVLVLPFENRQYPFLKVIPQLSGNGKTDALEFSNILTTLHTQYSKLYDDLNLSLFGGHSANWERPRPLEKELLDQFVQNVNGISDTSRSRIINALGLLRPSVLPLLESDITAKNYRSLTSHVYPTAGKSYSVTINFEEDRPVICFRPFLFSDTGGAGLSSVNNIVVKTKKNDEIKFNSEQMKLRKDFQHGVLASFGFIQ